MMDSREGRALFATKGLRVWYTPGKEVLKDFSLELGEGEVVGLIGLNGAGKTTFLRTVSGLLDSWEAREVCFEGAPIRFRDRAFQRERFCVFSEDSSFGYFTFREYLSYVAGAYGQKDPDPSELIEGFHFQEYADTLLKELSTGNRKKAYLITAFCLRPRLLLLDEPVNGLDFSSTEYLYSLINAYRPYGTVLFSSHILESITLTSDRVLVLEEGKIEKTFSREEVDARLIREVLKE